VKSGQDAKWGVEERLEKGGGQGLEYSLRGIQEHGAMGDSDQKRRPRSHEQVKAVSRRGNYLSPLRETTREQVEYTWGKICLAKETSEGMGDETLSCDYGGLGHRKY